MHEEKILFSLSHLPDILARRAAASYLFEKEEDERGSSWPRLEL